MHPVPAIPPAVVLGAFLVLLGTQVAYLIAPARASYLVRLGASAVAVAAGELAGWGGLGAHLQVGQLHLYQDVLLLALAQIALARWRRPLSTG
ncbi:MAG TPA: hypothetical protein VET65_06255 [Candidatus Limnocylindrales bacterium]|nr:hypothetical protein [Candidatus Limnocylindrales bacterium]